MEERLRNIERVDLAALHDQEIETLKRKSPRADLPFRIGKMGHAVLMVQDIDASVEFYTQLLGFKVSDVYPESMTPGRMVFMRFNEDHHGLGLVGAADAPSGHHELHHMAFEVSTIDEVFKARDFLEQNGVQIDFAGRRRAGAQVSVEFRDPDGHRLEIFWGLDRLDWDDEARPPEEWRPKLSLEEAVDDAPPGQDTTLANPALRRT
jgi:catechol 2,3-dioxygenase-like lactoylglutathione lyase family enzyme